MKVYDISQPVDGGTAVWPGEEPVDLRWTMRRADGDSVNVAAITRSTHTGTHADGPLHVDDDAAPIGAQPLEPFVGRARVVDAVGRGRLDEDVVDELDLAAVERVLFRTREAVDPTVFPERFAALSPALARRLVESGVRLVGTDAPSVDPPDSDELPVHRILMRGGAAIVENLVLDAVAPGEYTLAALPIKLMEADSAPVRAVLMQEGP